MELISDYRVLPVVHKTLIEAGLDVKAAANVIIKLQEQGIRFRRVERDR